MSFDSRSEADYYALPFITPEMIYHEAPNLALTLKPPPLTNAEPNATSNQRQRSHENSVTNRPDMSIWASHPSMLIPINDLLLLGYGRQGDMESADFREIDGRVSRAHAELSDVVALSHQGEH